MAEPMVSAQLDQRSYDAARKRIDQFADRPLARRAKKAYFEGAKLAVRPMQREAPRGATGNLRRSIAARNPRLRAGEMAVASVGPRGGKRKGGHGVLVTRGTRPHSLAAVRHGPWVKFPDGEVRPGALVMHPGARGNPFVDRTMDRYGDEVQSFIAREVLALGGGFRPAGSYLEGR